MDSLKGGTWVPAGAWEAAREAERAELETLAAGTLHEWFTDYTPPLADGNQRRVIAVDYRDDGLTFLAAVGPHFNRSSARRYAVTVTVREIPSEPAGEAAGQVAA